MCTDSAGRSDLALEHEFFHETTEGIPSVANHKSDAPGVTAFLSGAASLDDAAVITELLNVGIRPRVIQAFVLTPAIYAAWSSGSVLKNERSLVMSSLAESGVPMDSAVAELVSELLNVRPSHSLIRVWRQYVSVLQSILQPGPFQVLRQAAVRRAIRIAEAATGGPGVHRVSMAEAKAIQEIDDAFLDCQSTAANRRDST